MAKKIVLETRSEPAFFTLIGISCHLLDYRLIYDFNHKMDFNFIKESDFIRSGIPAENNSTFSFYFYKDEDQRRSYYLLSNRSREGFLFPTLKQADFLLVIEGFFRKAHKENFLSSVRSIPKVITAFEVKSTELKHLESFLFDLELHIMQINKELKQQP